MAFVVISILLGLLLTSVIFLIWVELSLRNILRGRKKAEEKLRAKVQQGEVGLTLKHVHNQDITQSFIRKFNEAYEETAGCLDFHNGETTVWFKIEDVTMSEDLADELEKSGFYVGNNREGL